MEDRGFEIVGIAGSLRQRSLHRGLIRAAADLVPGGVTVEPFETLGKVPFFNQDLEYEGDPEPVRLLKERIREADAVVIATPEYDYAIPGEPTTALDWALRPPSPLRHKPVGIVGASPGGVGTARGQMVLRQILLHAPAYVMPEAQMLIPNSYGRFNQYGDLTEENTRRRLGLFLDALRRWSETVRKDEQAEKATKTEAFE